MTTMGPVGDPLATLELSTLRLMVAACDRFGSELRTGGQPHIEDYLAQVGPREQATLLRALLSVELEFLTALGEQPDRAAYRARFPDHAELVETAFADAPTSNGKDSGATTNAIWPPTSEQNVPPSGAHASPRFPDQAEHRFRVLQEHARGGIGVVYLAHDAELDRQVALKELQNERANDARSQAYFVREAFITGGLEHPNIVSVHGFGRYRDGRPYYAMRLIRGESLKDAISAFHANQQLRTNPSERSLQLRRLITQFIDACNAVAYAHDRGILNRDIKPANIMVGKYGETLVVDWGLAKVVGRPDDPEIATDEPGWNLAGPDGSTQETQPGSTLGTPQYMPPEQADGQHDQLGPRSDVYSLGATLYTILTGQPPFPRKSVADVLNAVRCGDFPPPRALDPSIPRPLNAICLKAMALQPADRYPSAKALAEDIEHWLADEPVTALRDPLIARLGRWARRHKPMVAGLASLVLATTFGLAIGATLLNRANQKITENYELAEENYRLAREAVDQFYMNVSEDTLLNQPHMEPLRRKLLESARSYYERFTSQRAADPNARAGVGRALTRLSMLESTLGEMPVAIDHAERASHLLAALARDYPEVASYRQDLAASHNHLGNLYASSTRPSKAEAAFQHALTLQEQLAEQLPEVAMYRQDLAGTQNNLGNLYSSTGRTTEAEAIFRQAIALREQLVEQLPEVAMYRQDLAGTQCNLGTLYSSTGRTTEAETAFRHALTLQERLVEQFPEVTAYQRDLAGTQGNLGTLCATTGRGTEAEVALRLALALQTRLAERYPDVATYRRDLAGTHYNLGVLCSSTGRASEAEAALRLALELQERLAEQHPEDTAYRQNLASSHNSLGVLFANTGRASEAEAAFRHALALRERLAKQFPEQVDLLVDLGGSYGNLGNFLCDSGKPEQAFPWFDRAETTHRSVLDRVPHHSLARPGLLNTINGRARALNRLGRHAEAAESLARAIPLETSEDSYIYRFEYVRSLALAGDHAQAAREATALADASWKSGVDLYNVACALALAAAAQTADQADQAASLTLRALDALHEAREAGHFDNPASIAHMDMDTDLDSIRQHPGFLAFRSALESKESQETESQ